MKEFTVIYTDGRTETLSSPGRRTLLKDHFDNDEEKFRSEVSMLKWTTLATEYVIDVQNGENNAQIFSADVNPYGWRK